MLAYYYEQHCMVVQMLQLFDSKDLADWESPTNRTH
jgi:hypothetical protein